MTTARRQFAYTDPVAILQKQVARLAGQAAKRRLEELYQTSRLVLPKTVDADADDHEEDHNQQQQHQQPMLLSWDDVFVEDLLGMGSFGSVCLVTCPKLRWQREREQQLCQRRQRQRQLTVEEKNRQLQQQQEQHDCDLLSEEERNAPRNRNLNFVGGVGQEEKEEKDDDDTESKSLGMMQMMILDDNDNDDSSFVTTGKTIASSTILSSVTVSHASTTTSGFLDVQQQQHYDHDHDHDDHHDDHDDDDDDPHFLDRPNKYFACKSLSQKIIRQANVRGFVAAAADLVHEAFLLKHIAPHPNIVRLYGIHTGGGSVKQQRSFRGDNSNNNINNNSDGSIDIDIDINIDIDMDNNPDDDSDLGYFLVMEALTGGILSDKINDWRQMQLHRRIQQQRQKQHRERQQQQHNLSSMESILTSPDEQQQQQQQQPSSARRSSNNLLDAYQQLPTLEERLGIAIQIATAIQHLHNHGIVYRDLKPQNVGLSVEASLSAGRSQQEPNQQQQTSLNRSSPPPSPPLHPPQHHQNQQVSLSWRLFDFGLAREVTPPPACGAASSKALDPPLSVCYGKAGSPRYMAPETMGGKRLRSTNYNGGKTKQHKSKRTTRGSAPGTTDTNNGFCYATFASDVYSFGVVLWELIGLQEFDRRYDSRPEDFESAVCDHRYRPNIQAVEQAIADDFAEYLQNSSSSSSNEPLTSESAVAASAAFLCRHRDLRKLVEVCWHEDCWQRPSFEFIISELKEMVPPPVPFFDDTNHPRQEQQQHHQQQHSVGRRSNRRRSSNSMLMAITDLFENDCMSLDEDDEFDNDNGDDDYEGNEHEHEDFRHQSFPTHESTFVLTIPKQHTHASTQNQPVAPFSLTTTNAGASLLSSSMSGLFLDSNDGGGDELSSSAILLDSTKTTTSKARKRSSI